MNCPRASPAGLVQQTVEIIARFAARSHYIRLAGDAMPKEAETHLGESHS
jgi:hypothetical protein